MDSFDSYLLRNLYKETTRDGDKLAEAEKQIDWERFRPIINPMSSFMHIDLAIQRGLLHEKEELRGIGII